MSALPLAGRRVLVTRAAHQAAELSEGLRALGAEPVEVPVLDIRLTSDVALLDRVLQRLDRYDWLLFTSANTLSFSMPGTSHSQRSSFTWFSE